MLNKDRSKCLDITGGKVFNGAAVQIWDCNGGQQQSFKWCSDGRIVSELDENMCLDAPGGDPYKPAEMQMWECNSRSGQYWKYDKSTMAIYPAQVGEKMCLDLVNGKLQAGTRVNLWYCPMLGMGEAWVPQPNDGNDVRTSHANQSFIV